MKRLAVVLLVSIFLLTGCSERNVVYSFPKVEEESQVYYYNFSTNTFEALSEETSELPVQK